MPDEMAKFVAVVLVAAALGGLAALGLMDAVAADHTITVGGVTVPVGAEARIYDVEQLRVGVFSSALLAAVVAFGLGLALDVPKRRRRR